MTDQMTATAIASENFSADAKSAHAQCGRYYTDPVVFDAEVNAIFQKEWQYFCHQSQISNVGDYLAGDICGEAIYVIRGKGDQIRTFYNVCQHRGHQLVKGQGNAKRAVVCPYHAWSYDHEGCLRAAAKMNEVKDFDRSTVRLTAVQTEVIGGFVFVNLDPEAKSLRELAPQFEPQIMSMVAEAPDLQYVKQEDYGIKANWKVVTENFLEAYHVEFSGPAHVGLGNIIDTDTYVIEIDDRTIEYTAAGGKPDVIPYDVNQKDDFTNTRNAPFHQIFLWPNMTFSVFPGTNMLFVFNIRPTGPEEVAEEIVYFTLDGEMNTCTKTAEAYVSQQLNREDVELVEGVQRGLRSKGYKAGRLMVDPEGDGAWSEHLIHHFNSINIKALESNAR